MARIFAGLLGVLFLAACDANPFASSSSHPPKTEVGQEWAVEDYFPILEGATWVWNQRWSTNANGVDWIPEHSATFSIETVSHADSVVSAKAKYSYDVALMYTDPTDLDKLPTHMLKTIEGALTREPGGIYFRPLMGPLDGSTFTSDLPVGGWVFQYPYKELLLRLPLRDGSIDFLPATSSSAFANIPYHYDSTQQDVIHGVSIETDFGTLRDCLKVRRIVNFRTEPFDVSGAPPRTVLGSETLEMVLAPKIGIVQQVFKKESKWTPIDPHDGDGYRVLMGERKIATYSIPLR